MSMDVPNPGSQGAIALGCICSPDLNDYGEASRHLFVYNANCKLHWTAWQQVPITHNIVPPINPSTARDEHSETYKAPAFLVEA